jgi:outer membrane receptor protein involved in Fe transport
VRLTKNFKFDQLRTGVNFEVYNIFNSNTVLTENNTYRDASLNGWRIPTSMPPRFIKLSVQLDF